MLRCHRFHFSLILLAIAATALTNCRTPPRFVNECASGIGSVDRNHPLICIDDTTGALKANPEEITINDVQGPLGGKGTETPVTVRWQTKSGGRDLAVDFDKNNKGCVEKIECNRNGQCVAVAMRQTAGQKKRCTYSMNLEGRRSDPVIVVDTCCGP